MREPVELPGIVDARNETWVLCKNSVCSELLSRVPAPGLCLNSYARIITRSKPTTIFCAWLCPQTSLLLDLATEVFRLAFYQTRFPELTPQFSSSNPASA